MANQTEAQHIPSQAYMPLSSIIKNPRVSAAFLRAEHDMGGAFVLPAPKPKTLLPAAAAVERYDMEGSTL